MASPVRMKHKAFRTFSSFIGFTERLFYQVDIRPSGDVPCNDLAREQIHDDTQVIPLSRDFDVSKVTDPDDVGSGLVECLLKMVSAFTVVLMAIVTEGLLRGHPGELKVLHQSVHSADTDVNAIITPEDISDLIGTQTFVVIGIDAKDHLGDFLIFLSAIRRS